MCDGRRTHTHLLSHAHVSGCTPHSDMRAYTHGSRSHEKGVCSVHVVSLHLAFSTLMFHSPSLLFPDGHFDDIIQTFTSRVWLMRQSENPRHCVFGVDIAFAVVFGDFLSFADQRKLLVASSFQRADHISYHSRACRNAMEYSDLAPVPPERQVVLDKRDAEARRRAKKAGISFLSRAFSY